MLNEAARFDVATAAIKGGRDYQEDSLIASFPQGQEIGFAVLADGMGGHLSGDVASALVMSEVFRQIKMKEMVLNNKITDISGLLYNTATTANECVTQHIEDTPETYGMGSTLLATVIRGDELYWVSVGDSPLYLFRDGELRQLNQDHSMAPQIDMMVKVGAMDPEVGRDHPDRNTLTSAIAGVDIDKIDCPDDPTTVLPGDIIIVSSDGLQFLQNDQIAAILQKTQDAGSSAIAQALLAAIEELDDPDQDNTAFTVIKLGELKEAVQSVPKEPTDVLVRLRTDLNRLKPVEPEVAEQTDGDTSAPEPIGIPEKRVIRLVTSKALNFDKPDAPKDVTGPVEKVRPQGHGSWYRRQRSLND